MSGLLAFSISLTRRWVSLYTRDLPDRDRALRRDEIDSDLWEHQHLGLESGQASTATGLDIFIRLALGVPADLAWRRAAIGGSAHGRRHITDPSRLSKGGLRAMKRTLGVAAIILTLVIAVINIVGGVGLALSENADRPTTFVGMAVLVASGALLIAGIAASRRSRHLGTSLVTIGAVAGGVSYFLLILTSTAPTNLGPLEILVTLVAIGVPLLLAGLMIRRARSVQNTSHPIQNT